MSRLAKATISLVILVMLFMPGAMAASVASFDATPNTYSSLGPDSVAFDSEGHGPYSGVSDGRVLKWNGDKQRDVHRVQASPGDRYGRPLGLQFHHKSENLYIADAYKGLMRVGPAGGEATVLVNQVDGAPLCFTNGVDVDQITGQVYLTDSSTKGDSTGRLMRYDPHTNDVTMLQSGITYPNGVSISHDRTHLVVASTAPCKLLRHRMKGPNAGKTEPFADLPGYRDNVRQDKRGGYWVALHREKNELPFEFGSHLLVVRVGPNRKIIEEMKGLKSVRPTEIMERGNGKYYMRSVELPYVGVVTRK
ncbi:LOW QUALITY PROTEIN: hypothetical protein BRADI_1g55514v3 [Brachypodium distachyon]|uniref:Strictosidine synthase conserved region domain-containing protein n=1 Tax=Brachypodium distachyon TaxID=15368 RepID=A0A2K2DRK8_BRADI|nr:LOW QUALITY PROTEIN: hypothetical protein BRADI_1g55514v3 [Brachypodium distachyon]